jgi:hypothetical protein
VSGEKKPAPFIVQVLATYTGYGDSRRPVAELLLSDGSKMTLENEGGESYTGNVAGPKLLSALQNMLVLPAVATELSAKVRATAREALKEAYK